MFFLTHYERKVIIFLSLLLGFGAILKYSRIRDFYLKNLSQQNQTILVNINTASEEELEKLPYISKKIASRIVMYRQKHKRFNNLQDLLKIKGIGPKKIEIIKDYITF